MKSFNVQEDYLLASLAEAEINGWEDISRQLKEILAVEHKPLAQSRADFLKKASQGSAFLTFDIGIDGVSIEMSKYARVLEKSLLDVGDPRIHFIAGDFLPQADSILSPAWSRYLIEGINGWAKWDGGKWFDALYFNDMPLRSSLSVEIANQIYQQAVNIGQALAGYLLAHQIILLIPVNVASNPGNLALALALAMVTESLGTAVLNINHDFYWDGGKPAIKRKPGEEPGSRDHFFRNYENKPFFELLQSLYPWNGRRWLQVNINRMQSRRLIRQHSFPKERVFEISTSVYSSFFAEYSADDVSYSRLRMAHILSGGNPVIKTRSLKNHLAQLPAWMNDQKPVVVGARDGLELDVTADDIFYLLQPTRVIGRKRIERGVQLLEALLNGPLQRNFIENEECQLVLHITGPTPLEHQLDLEIILDSYGVMIENLPENIAERIFLAFSCGHESHPSFDEKDFIDLNIAEIYWMATVILFPSEIEGRGLPIIESAAVGIPIICSRYQPEEVFDTVIGEDLPKEFRIRYLLFPEGDFPNSFLRNTADLLANPDAFRRWRSHNRRAVRIRYSERTLQQIIMGLLDNVYSTGTAEEY